MKSSTTKRKVDRLVILVSGEDILKLLEVTQIPSGTGEAQATAVFKTIKDWGLVNQVTSMCLDTTASNTGKTNGACVKLQNKMGKTLFSFACRHHILELLPGAILDFFFGPSSGPNVPLFQQFSEACDSLDHTLYHAAMEDPIISRHIIPIKNELNTVIRQQLAIFHPRGDYKELLFLILTFLGEKIAEKEIKIFAPEAYQQARWMAKIIYCMKIYIFRNQLQLKAKDLNGLREFNIFIVTVYLQNWYTCQSPVLAP